MINQLSFADTQRSITAAEPHTAVPASHLPARTILKKVRDYVYRVTPYMMSVVQCASTDQNRLIATSRGGSTLRQGQLPPNLGFGPKM